MTQWLLKPFFKVCVFVCSHCLGSQGVTDRCAITMVTITYHWQYFFGSSPFFNSSNIKIKACFGIVYYEIHVGTLDTLHHFFKYFPVWITGTISWNPGLWKSTGLSTGAPTWNSHFRLQPVVGEHNKIFVCRPQSLSLCSICAWSQICLGLIFSVQREGHVWLAYLVHTLNIHLGLSFEAAPVSPSVNAAALFIVAPAKWSLT